ncbi:hypothetical protein RJ639_028264 [Escallonia herrerae]|uniref:Uncharacterized protein n=1 Tax=Escallonia herrerae TaxID=1293975 RepID=A0AA89BQ55_9ASTE|nr:hypothetical protein RJ639_028264 [Escallonia herrerae]
MGKQPVRMRAVVYALSPFQQKVMPGLWKDFTGKIHHKYSLRFFSGSQTVGFGFLDGVSEGDHKNFCSTVNM